MKAIITLLTAASLLACNNSENKPNEQATVNTNPPQTGLVFDKLVGTWQNDDQKSFERWHKNDDGTYGSAGFQVKGTDTSWNEQALIYPENNAWIFANTVKGQNDGKPVKFTSILVTGNRVQFNNPAHDFPTDINYTLADINTLEAFIVGPNTSGGKDTIPFTFKRLK